jgi:hypothetical protein
MDLRFLGSGVAVLKHGFKYTFQEEYKTENLDSAPLSHFRPRFLLSLRSLVVVTSSTLVCLKGL